MVYLVIAFLGLIIILLALVLILTKVEVSRMKNSLKNINEAKSSNQKVMLSFPDRQLEKLAEQINDTLEQKKLSEAIYKRKDLQLRQSIANISHDLRTPLTSIIGYVQLLQDEFLPVDMRKQYIEIVLERSKSLHALISDFFDLSRYQAGDYNIELKSIRLQDILLKIVASFYNDFESKGMEPHIQIDETIPGIIADENVIKRIYHNLIQNVLKHGSGNVSISLALEQGKVISKISNNAPGLTQEDVTHLFDRSFTADRMRSSRNTGLGLTITKALVEVMEGTIYPSLEDGKLSIVIVWTNACK